MSPLPSALASWEPFLTGLPEEVVVSIGDWLVRLDLAIGPLRIASKAGSGDMDGYSGITRRGTYDRLLVSEWLLAEEMPDEFIRRAAMGEHLFFDPHRREPAGSRRSIALFDVGPDQLGAPRLVHLAAALVLERRAANARVPFAIAAVHEREERPWTGPIDLHRLLATRSMVRGHPGDVASWLDRIGAPGRRDDLWIVGAAPTPVPLGASRVVVQELLDPVGPRRVDVQVKAEGAVARRVVLDVPDDRTAIRLLREPLVRATPNLRRLPALAPARLTGLRFSADGRRLLAFVGPRKVAAFHVPNSPRASPSGRVRHFEALGDNQLVAVGWCRRRLISVTNNGTNLRAWRLEPLVPWQTAAPTFEFGYPLPVAVAPQLPICALQHLDLMFGDGAGGLWRWQLSDSKPERPAEIQNLAERAAAVTLTPRVVWIETAGGRRLRMREGVTADIEGVDLGEGEPVGFFGWGGGLHHALFGLVAVPMADSRWRLVHGAAAWSREARITELTAPAGTTVVGVTANIEHNEPALVVLDDDRRTIWLLGPTSSQRLPPTRSPIVAACASPQAPHVAWTSEDGSLGAYAVDVGGHLLRAAPAPGEP